MPARAGEELITLHIGKQSIRRGSPWEEKSGHSTLIQEGKRSRRIPKPRSESASLNMPKRITRGSSPVWMSNSEAPFVTSTHKDPYAPEGDPPEWINETREEYIERLRNTPTHLCRIRHFDINRWSMAFYTYSNERYEPCFFPTGDWFGTPEEAFDIGAVYLER